MNTPTRIIASLLLGALLCSCASVNPHPVFKGDYIEVKDADTLPVLLTPLKVAYPRAAMRKGRQGRIVVEFIVDAKGIPTQLHVVEATSLVFTSAALQSVRNLRFTPATRDGKPVAIHLMQPIEFRIVEDRWGY